MLESSLVANIWRFLGHTRSCCTLSCDEDDIPPEGLYLSLTMVRLIDISPDWCLRCQITYRLHCERNTSRVHPTRTSPSTSSPHRPTFGRCSALSTVLSARPLSPPPARPPERVLRRGTSHAKGELERGASPADPVHMGKTRKQRRPHQVYRRTEECDGDHARNKVGIELSMARGCLVGRAGRVGARRACEAGVCAGRQRPPPQARWRTRRHEHDVRRRPASTRTRKMQVHVTWEGRGSYRIWKEASHTSDVGALHSHMARRSLFVASCLAWSYGAVSTTIGTA